MRDGKWWRVASSSTLLRTFDARRHARLTPSLQADGRQRLSTWIESTNNVKPGDKAEGTNHASNHVKCDMQMSTRLNGCGCHNRDGIEAKVRG